MRHVIDIGRRVQCDICPRDWTDRTESGGFLFGGHAICPDCATDFESHVEKSGEYEFITDRCPATKSFADWVREDLRQGKNEVIIDSLDEDDEFIRNLLPEKGE